MVSIIHPAKAKPSRSKQQIIFFGILLCLGMMWQMRNRRKLSPTLGSLARTERQTKVGGNIPPPYTCSFRDYGSAEKRKYGLTSEKYPPSFLRVAIYIYGKPPILLPIKQTEHHGDKQFYLSKSEGKVCRRYSEEDLWFEKETDTGEHVRERLHRPLMDGTNPSLIALERIRDSIPSQDWFPWKQILEDFPTAAYVVSSNIKKYHQCEYHSRSSKKDAHRAPGALPGRQRRNEIDLLIVDAHMRTLLQTTLWNETATVERTTDENTTQPASHYPADDGRLLVHDGAIWMTSKRYGGDGGKGYLQYLAQLRFQYDPRHSIPFRAYGVQERGMCCGRNYAALTSRDADVMGNEGKLPFLTLPDPVWIQSIDTRSSTQFHDMHIPIPSNISKNAWGKRSDFHGTSGFLLYLSGKDEYLGIGHFHRERRWSKDNRMDAKWGHHYTHAFFTISGQPPYVLKRLSQEFLFPSKVANFSRDADVVQFASGLEWVPDSSRRQVAIGYGINDCEGAIVYLDSDTIELMLHAVANGTQVAHTMTNITREILAQSSSVHFDDLVVSR
jgi:hypothetical protein